MIVMVELKLAVQSGPRPSPEQQIPEVIDHNVTGYIVDSMKEAVRAVERIDTLNRGLVRRVFE